MNTDSNIRLTVLMPVFNAALFLAEAIESVLSQTYRNFEFIIINDGSTDDSLNVIKSFNDTRIKLITNSKNLGIIESRNIGLKAAKGEYIANMDADDICFATRFEKQIKYLDEHPEVIVLATKLVLINPEGDEIGFWPEDYACVNTNEIVRTLPVINCIGQPTIMMRAKIVQRIMYNKKFIHNEDWGLWLHLLSLKMRIDKLPEVLLKYRQHPASTTVTANKLGIEKKVITFKFQYLKYKFLQNNFTYTDKYVLFSFLKELIRFVLKGIAPRVYSFAARIKKIEKLRYIKQYLKVSKQLKQFDGTSEQIYFFPFYHMGGAERVHASILEVTSQPKSITFITSKSLNSHFYSTFSKYSTVIEIDELIKLGFSERWLIKNCKRLISKSQNPTVFGCNSLFFYQVIPYFSSNVKVIDLLHAFVHEYEQGPEKWSLPYVDRIDKRVVINKKTKEDFITLYRKNHVNEKNVAKIQVIQNFVELQGPLSVKSDDVLNIAYVGRGGEEKRVNLIAELAKKIVPRHQNIQFHFVGKVKEVISPEFYPFCVFHDEISDEVMLQNFYKSTHILIIASSREGFPMVIMEAMMQGGVPISTNVGGISEHIKNNVNGFLIDSINEEDIISDFETKINYLNTNRKELLQVSENAYTYALNNFNKANFVKEWTNLFKNNKT